MTSNYTRLKDKALYGEKLTREERMLLAIETSMMQNAAIRRWQEAAK